MSTRDVVIYTTMFCPFCQKAKSLLSQKGVAFQEIPVDGDAAARRAMAEKSGGRTTVPQIFIGGEHVGGCDDLHALEQAGTLDTILHAAVD